MDSVPARTYEPSLETKRRRVTLYARSQDGATQLNGNEMRRTTLALAALLLAAGDSTAEAGQRRCRTRPRPPTLRLALAHRRPRYSAHSFTATLTPNPYENDTS